MSAAFVLDACCAIAALLSDEAGTESDVVLRRLSRETPWVPPLWFTEVGNALEMARRRKRVTSSDLDSVLKIIPTWGLSVDREDPVHLLPRIVELSARHELTVYDATYLELALRLGAPLATFDKNLAERATRAGATILA